ncbi:DUF2238 domain-containing protein [Pontixanthobacter aquaemixtae]|uniref:DUF2238 domain-containing protein n=1 Tax=Pontixanthobacter aquaemixtae TaxID=1958940 RepID=A0A844ZSF6_9SPHN|nr:DUF2238 domain-containing protein [Pontixanthobacter aquaemixtae]MXO90668.1 DUF2238 domain-containing protein [Pontixanthobacter aquaemixtae]
MIGGLPSRQFWLILGSIVLAAGTQINPLYPAQAPLQTIPTILVLIAAFFALRKWPLPTSAVACFCLFLALHSIGARYIYSYVPYDAWVNAIGLPGLSEIFGWERNHYDRLVHFAFGALLVHPFAQMLEHQFGVTPKRALYVAAEFIIAASALYEVFEWMLTLALASAEADAYNGQQGDIWDAQKDMALASLGAIIAAFGEYFWRKRA